MINDFECLINKKLIETSILSEDKCTITLKTETSTITLQAEGDCCSISWVEHFDGIPAGETIKEVIDKPVNKLREVGSDGNEFWDELLQYFYEIVTDKASHTIEMRNENNGYYGGYFDVSEIKNET